MLRAASTEPAAAAAAVPLPLPEDWVAGIDASSGAVYYFNNLTQESTWNRP